MKKRDRKALGRYARDLADKLELRDWTVTIGPGDPGGPERADGKRWGACSDSIPGRKYVTVTLTPDCREWSREDLRATVAHELIHAHLAPLMEVIRTDLAGHLAPSTHEVLCDGTTRHMEFAVDALADATAKHLPLIDWPDPK